MILAVHFIPASARDSKGMMPLIKKVRSQHSQEAMSERGYKSKENDGLLAVCCNWSLSNPRESFNIVRDPLYVLCIYLLQSFQLRTSRAESPLKVPYVPSQHPALATDLPVLRRLGSTHRAVTIVLVHDASMG